MAPALRGERVEIRMTRTQKRDRRDKQLERIWPLFSC
jgi:hypothetical protein